jgi:hypothetical protein
MAEVAKFVHGDCLLLSRAVAQLVARTPGGREVVGSSPAGPTQEGSYEVSEIKSCIACIF